jgi:hypothetical protein
VTIGFAFVFVSLNIICTHAVPRIPIEQVRGRRLECDAALHLIVLWSGYLTSEVHEFVPGLDSVYATN